MSKLRIGDLSGAVADLGVLVPLSAALVLVNGIDAAALFIGAGALALAAGLFFRIPFPVQPLKALTALAVAQGLSPETIHAAGLSIGILFLILGATRLADRLAVFFTKEVIRSLQFGVGLLLVVTAIRLVVDPPPLFGADAGSRWGLALGAAALVCVAVAGRYEWNAAGIVILLGGVAVGWIVAAPSLGPIDVALPTVSVPPASVFGTAFVVLVIPQVPLTYGNAVVGVSDLAREYFGPPAARVTPRAVALSCGLGNVGSALIGGMPMCHGSSGLSAHIRLGARSSMMNALLGTTLIGLGLVYSAHVVALLGALPVWVLGGFLGYAGIRHALLVIDLRGARLAIAIGAGLAGVVTGNLAITTAAAMATSVTLAHMGERERGREEERDESVPERVPAVDSTDDDEDATNADKEKQDATADHASEQSMDGSDPPAW